MTNPRTFSDRVARIFKSPGTFPFFLIIPLAVIATRVLRIPVPATNLLLANNLLLLTYLTVRLVLLLRGAARALRYREDSFRPKKGTTVSLSGDAVRQHLEGSGYRFNDTCSYGEKREVGYWGTVLMHAGLVLLLVFGSYDNMHTFTGSFLLGVGDPLPLYEKGVYRFWSQGLLTSYNDIDMKLKVRERFLPSERYPAGATEIVLLDKKGNELQQGVVDPRTSMSQGHYTVGMTRFVYDAWVVVTTTPGNLVVFTDWIKLLPRADASGTYTHYNDFTSPDGKVAWRAWFDQAHDRLRFQMDKDGRGIVDVVLGMGPEYRKDVAGYSTTLQGIGKWTEFRIVRKRHVPVLIAGGLIALLGLLVRMVYRARRVWVEQAGDGSVIRTTDRRLVQALLSDGRPHEG
ncbi:MAG TPA: cytochrome c biogenesis protein ResB [Geobacteraceae bacterium]